MITVLTGPNSFEIRRTLSQLTTDFSGNTERVDGASLELPQLADIFAGSTLFADKRLIIVRGLSDNKTLWSVLPDILPRLSDDSHVVLVEDSLDKRLTTYKALKKVADIREFPLWTDKDSALAQKWVQTQARDMGLDIAPQLTRRIVDRVGVDQWQLLYALEKLSFVPDITQDVIDDVIDAQPTENVFNVFDAALKGDRQKVAAMIRILETTEDPYRLFGLLSGQAFQLAAVAVSTADNSPAKDLGIHPYALQKMTPIAKSLGRSGARKVVRAFAKADDDIKLSRADPWLLIERALLSIV